MATGGIQQTEGDSMVSQTLTPGAEEREEDPGETLKDLEGAGKNSDTDNGDTDSTKDTIPGHDGTSDESETDSGNADSETERNGSQRNRGGDGRKRSTSQPEIRDSSDGGMVHPEPQKVCELCDDPGILAGGHCSECAQDLCFGCIHRRQRMSIVGSHTTHHLAARTSTAPVV